jgi:hypothetical protein
MYLFARLDPDGDNADVQALGEHLPRRRLHHERHYQSRTGTHPGRQTRCENQEGSQVRLKIIYIRIALFINVLLSRLPLPENSEARRLSLQERTVFVCGFARDGSVTLDDLIEFFETNFEKVCNIRMRRGEGASEVIHGDIFTPEFWQSVDIVNGSNKL